MMLVLFLSKNGRKGGKEKEARDGVRDRRYRRKNALKTRRECAFYAIRSHSLNKERERKREREREK